MKGLQSSFFLCFFFSINAFAAQVDIILTGEVSSSHSALFKAGDAFNLHFSYSLNSLGTCNGGRGFGDSIYQCTDSVDFASATIGDIAFAFPASNTFPFPADSSSSRLSFENEISSLHRDQFQGGMKFQNVAQIMFPSIAFYLTDSTASFFNGSAKVPNQWVNGDNGDIRRFDERTAILYSYASANPAQGFSPISLAEITISPNAVFSPVTPVPLPAAALLFFSSLFGLGGINIFRKK